MSSITLRFLAEPSTVNFGGKVLATQEPVKLLEPPFELPAYAVKQHWHERFHADAGNAWLRATLAELLRDR